MAYLKPPAVVKKVFNPIAMRFGLGGSTALVVRRRTTGATQQIPVIPVELGGSRYVVSTRGESDWVRNLRAAGAAELGGRAFTATEIETAERAPVIAAYRAKAGKTVETYWKQLPEPQDHPTFRLDPA